MAAAEDRRPLVVTQGDPAGVGPELALRAWSERRARALPPFVWIGDPRVLEGARRTLDWEVPLAVGPIAEVAGSYDSALPVVPASAIPPASPPDFGQPDPASAPATIAAIRDAVALAAAGQASALVTLPIAKHVLYAAGFDHPGHTEFLASLAAPTGARTPRPVMLIWSETLAVVPVTIHVPLRRAPELLTTELIVETARIVDRDYRIRFGVARPRLALAGLNPHAGENGAMGTEDGAVIAPAIAQLRAEGIDAVGPLPADTMFHPRAHATYDVALGMYHDQALIPVKTLAFDEGVNVTLGLPFIRTSPDHGTAFDIAGKGDRKSGV
jgi:4-hydroxythreonine-4-phosphate dehydrogenase